MLAVLQKLIPLYAMIFLGYLGGRLFQPNPKTVARVMIYGLGPFVIFGGVVQISIDVSVIAAPFLLVGLSSLIGWTCLQFGRQYWSDRSAYLLAHSAGSANVAYFGLAVADQLFDAQALGVYIVAMLGMTLFENSVGFYFIASGAHPAKECLHKVLKLPTLHALLIGIAWNLLNWPLPNWVLAAIAPVRDVYCILGMMIIGLGLAPLRRFALDQRFLTTLLACKFISWPVLMSLIVWIDHSYLHLFTTATHSSFLLISLMPVAANTVLFASLFDAEPAKASTAVCLSTVIALPYVPWMWTYWMHPLVSNFG